MVPFNCAVAIALVAYSCPSCGWMRIAERLTTPYLAQVHLSKPTAATAKCKSELRVCIRELSNMTLSVTVSILRFGPQDSRTQQQA